MSVGRIFVSLCVLAIGLSLAPRFAIASVVIDTATFNADANAKVTHVESSDLFDDDSDHASASGNNPLGLFAEAMAELNGADATGTATNDSLIQFIGLQTVISAIGTANIELNPQPNYEPTADATSSMSVTFTVDEDTPFEFNGMLSFIENGQFAFASLTNDNTDEVVFSYDGPESGIHFLNTLDAGETYRFEAGSSSEVTGGVAAYDAVLTLNPIQGVVPEPAALAIWSLIALSVGAFAWLQRSTLLHAWG